MVVDDRDLVTNILSRLPLKSLLRCKSVCKWWHLIISDRIFLRDYSLGNPHHYVSGLFLQKFLFFKWYSDLEFIKLDGHAHAAPEISLSFINDNEGACIEHSCNGLLCCRSFRSLENERIYYICKPTTKQYITLPKPKCTTVFGINVVFDPSKSLHYKVVCICDSELSENHRDINIYSSETCLWRLSGDPFSVSCDFLFNRGVFWNGSLHWIGRGELSLRYDVEAECLLAMPIPPIPNGWVERRLGYFGESHGHLHLIEIYGPRTTLFDVLEMKSDHSGWFVKYHVDLDVVAISYTGMVRFNVQQIHRFVFSILHLTRGRKGRGVDQDEEESCLLLHIPGKFISYNLRDRTFAEIHPLLPPLTNTNKDLGLTYSWENVYQYTNTLSYL